MQIKLRTLLLVLPFIAASCSDAFDSPLRPAGTIRVTVGSDPRIGIQSNSRTAIESDGQTIHWNTSDKIALWAVNAENQAAISGQAFDLWHYNASFNAAKFTANVPALPEGTYNYYAASPLPASINGTQATYTLPAVQEFKTAELGAALTNLPYDILVADPVEGNALVEGDNSDIVNLAFRHKVHLLKVTVESNSLGQRVSEVALTFPSPVVGTLTLDVANPDAEPVLTDGSNTLVIRFDRPVEPGTTVIAAIAPIDLPASESVQIVSYGETHESLIRNFPGKNFAAGRTTPLFYNIPAQGREFTRLTFSLPIDKGTNTLGEIVTTIKLTAPEGSKLGSYNDTVEFTPDADGKFGIYLSPGSGHNLSDKKLEVRYESENAFVSNTLTLPQLTEYEDNNATFSVPYLLAEDFSSVDGFSNHDNAGGGVTIDAYLDAIALDNYGLPGWSGTRCGAEAGNAFRICVRTEDAWLSAPRYQGRLDSAPISGIKAGKSVKVAVSFNYSINISWDKHKPLVAYGYHTTPDLINSINSGSTALSNPVAQNLTGNNGSYSSITSSASYTIPTCTNTYRLAWNIYSANRKTGNSNGWCYIDNIKVSIVK